MMKIFSAFRSESEELTGGLNDGTPERLLENLTTGLQQGVSGLVNL